MTDSFKARTTLKVGAQQYDILSLAALKSQNVDRLPFSLKILLENLLRFEDGVNVTKADMQGHGERHILVGWGQIALSNFKVGPPNTGIVHQVNIERLARVIFSDEAANKKAAYPDTLVGTDSHTTMVNGLGVLGWGVGGIEAEAAMLGQPVTMLIPQVIGFKLTGKLKEGATATDFVLTVTEMLRKHGVVGKFVEYFGPGLKDLPLADRATIANMSPE